LCDLIYNLFKNEDNKHAIFLVIYKFIYLYFYIILIILIWCKNDCKLNILALFYLSFSIFTIIYFLQLSFYIIKTRYSFSIYII
jgi:hypothetical protein